MLWKTGRQRYFIPDSQSQIVHLKVSGLHPHQQNNNIQHVQHASGRVREGRSCEDNITRLVQKIKDGFDQKPPTMH